MSKDMLGVCVRKLVRLPADEYGIVYDFLEKLSDPEWIKAAKEFLRKENSWGKARQAIKKETEALLELITTVTVPATNEKFVARDRFKKDTNAATVKISSLGSNFLRWFGDKVEDLIPETVLSCYKLKRSSADCPILGELGGTEEAETTLSVIYALMQKQGHGQDGALLTNGDSNVFYVRDINGVIRAVYVCWRGRGWSVSARKVGNPRRWYDGHLVFSP